MNQTQSTTSEDVDMSPKEMVANLTKLKNTLDDKMRLFDGKKKEADSQLNEVQNKAIESLFKVLQENGVNLEDRNSVNAFLENLKQVNPEGYIIFEKAIGNLIEQKQDLSKMQPPEGFSEPPNPMEQLAQEPGSPAGAVNDVSEIPAGPVGPNAQPLPMP